jgi:hypothetical protein
MKYPIEPRPPYAPVEPKEFFEKQNPVIISHQEDMDWTTFVAKLPTNVNVSDLRFSYTTCYHDEYSSDDYTEIYYITMEKTTNYKSQMIAWRKQMKDYAKQMKKYKEDRVEYLEQMKFYNVWAEEQELKNCKKRIKELEKKRANKS